MPPQSDEPDRQRRWNERINRLALATAVFLTGIGGLRLFSALLDGEILPLRPLDGWLWMSLRALAVVFSLGMLTVRRLRQRYFLLLLALVMLTAAGLWLRLASLLPVRWQPAAGVAQLLMTMLGLGFLIAGLALGEDLAGFIQETWQRAFDPSSTHFPHNSS